MEEESKEVCTFKPKINTKRDYKAVQTRYLSPNIISNDVLKEINVENLDNKGYATSRQVIDS